MTLQPLQTASNIQIIQPLQTRPMFQSVNIMTAQPLTVLPISTVQSVRNQTISSSDIGSSVGTITSTATAKSSSANKSRLSTTASSSSSTTLSKSQKSKSNAASSAKEKEKETDIPKREIRTPSPAKTISLKSRLAAITPTTQPVVKPIKLIRKEGRDKPGNEKENKVITLKELPKEEKEAILRLSKPLRTPKLPTNNVAGNSGTGILSQSQEDKDDGDNKIKIEPRTQPISLYNKSQNAATSQNATRNETKKTGTNRTGRTVPRKTPTPPSTPGTTPTRPTKPVPTSSSATTKSESSTSPPQPTTTPRTTTSSNSFNKAKSAQNWTTKIVDNNSTILRSLPQGDLYI